MGRTGIRTFLRRRLNIRHIALMAQLDDARSVVRAAEAAGMSQPAASTLLRGFEEALDVPLFERHARGIAPTPYGEILVRHARAILAEIEQVQEEIASLKSGLSGQASVGAVTTPGTSLLPLAIGLLKQKHPGLLVGIEAFPGRAGASRCDPHHCADALPRGARARGRRRRVPRGQCLIFRARRIERERMITLSFDPGPALSERF